MIFYFAVIYRTTEKGDKFIQAICGAVKAICVDSLEAKSSGKL
jgi:hypothetical protein